MASGKRGALLLLAIGALFAVVTAGPAEVSVNFHSADSNRRCERVMFIWSRAQPEGRDALQMELEHVCKRIEGSDIPGKGCRVQFGASSAIPSITTTLEGCCDGDSGKLIQENYPGIRLCRDILEDESPIKPKQ